MTVPVLSIDLRRGNFVKKYFLDIISARRTFLKNKHLEYVELKRLLQVPKLPHWNIRKSKYEQIHEVR